MHGILRYADSAVMFIGRGGRAIVLEDRLRIEQRPAHKVKRVRDKTCHGAALDAVANKKASAPP